MRKLLDSIRVVKKTLEKGGYVIKDVEGKPFFGEIRIVFNDGQMLHAKHKSLDGEFEVTQSTKI